MSIPTDFSIPAKSVCQNCAHAYRKHLFVCDDDEQEMKTFSCLGCSEDNPYTNVGHCKDFVLDNLTYIELTAKQQGLI